ncbi:MAG: hypothetical protein DI570_17460 [Phenylobacterium zucineum]|nr:MAG: hypothetical protein DI570_17460 [Phenylobacterium zucineum]
MKLYAALSLAALALTGAGAPAAAAAKSPETPTAAAQPRQCFWTNRITNFASDDERLVNVRVGAKDIYQFEMLGRCNNVEWTTQVAVRSRGSTRICSGLDAEIIAPSQIGPQRCAVKNVRKLSEAEIKALPRRARP